MSTILRDPAEMIAKGAPRVIHNDAELEAYTDALFQLTALENPSRDEVEAIELLTGQQWPQRQITERAQRDRTGAASSDHRPLALRIWNESEPLFATPAEVYLHARSIDLDEIPDIDDVLR